MLSLVGYIIFNFLNLSFPSPLFFEQNWAGRQVLNKIYSYFTWNLNFWKEYST